MRAWVHLLADAAPTGAGLAIVGVILLVFLALCLLVAFFIIRGLVRLARRGRKDEIAQPPAAPPPPAG